MKFDTNVKITLIIFVILSIGVYYLKPPIMFNSDGSFKQFGLTRDKTIYPYWLSCLIVGIIVYLVIIIKNNEYI
jgi:hypothetical protein